MKKITQKEKCKMNTEEFIKNYNYKRRNVRHKYSRSVENGYKRFMKSLIYSKNHHNYDDDHFPLKDEYQENEDLFDLVYDIKRGIIGLEV